MQLKLRCHIVYNDTIGVSIDGIEQPLSYNPDHREYFCFCDIEPGEHHVTIRKRSILEEKIWLLNSFETIVDSIMTSKDNTSVIYTPHANITILVTDENVEVAASLDSNQFTIETNNSVKHFKVINQIQDICLKRWKITNCITANGIFGVISVILFVMSAFSLLQMSDISLDILFMLCGGVFFLILDIVFCRLIIKKERQIKLGDNSKSYSK